MLRCSVSVCTYWQQKFILPDKIPDSLEPILLLTVFPWCPTSFHPSPCNVAVQSLLSNGPYLAEAIQQYAFVLLSSISASIATIYLCVLTVSFLTPLILPDLFTNEFCISGSCLYPANTRHLNAQSHCWNPLNLSSKTELQKPEW